MQGKPNPMCACGCGLEVSTPTTKWVSGHSSKRKLTNDQLEVVMRLSAKGVSTYDLAVLCKVSQPTIAQKLWIGGYADRSKRHPHASGRITRVDDIAATQERKLWRKGKKILREARKFLKRPVSE